MAGSANEKVGQAGERALTAVASRYRRHAPERTVLHAAVRAHWMLALQAGVKQGDLQKLFDR